MAWNDFMQGFMPNQQEQMPQDDAMMQLELQRRMKFADALRQQEAPQGQMVSGHYVAPSWTQHLAGLADTYVAGKQEKEAMQQYGEAQQSKAQKLGELMRGKPTFEADEAGNQREVYKPYSNEELIGELSKVDSSYAPKLVEALVSSRFKEETPMVVGKNLVSKKGEVLFSAPEDPKSQYTNVQSDPQTGKMIGLNIKTNKVEELPGVTMTPKPAMTAYETESLGLRREEIKRKLDEKEGGKLDFETVDMISDQALAGDKSALTNLGRGNSGQYNMAAIRKRMNDKMRERGWTGADIAAANAEFMGLMAGERAVGTRGANVELAGSGFLNIVPIARAASDKIERSGFLPFGKVQIMFNEQTNNPDLNAFAAANNGLVNTYSRAISPTGVGTVKDREHARKILSEAKSKEAYNAAVETLRKEIEAETKAPKEVRERLRAEISGRSGTPRVNAKGWTLKTDKAGNKAYVSPDGSQYEEVR